MSDHIGDTHKNAPDAEKATQGSLKATAVIGKVVPIAEIKEAISCNYENKEELAFAALDRLVMVEEENEKLRKRVAFLGG